MTCIYDALYFVFFTLSNLNVEDSGGLGGNYGRRYGLVLYTWLTGMHLWRSDYSPFIRRAQLNYCRCLIVVPLSTFHRLAELIGDPKGELIFLFSTARCGSTLLTQVVHRITYESPTHKNPPDSKPQSLFGIYYPCHNPRRAIIHAG